MKCLITSYYSSVDEITIKYHLDRIILARYVDGINKGLQLTALMCDSDIVQLIHKSSKYHDWKRFGGGTESSALSYIQAIQPV